MWRGASRAARAALTAAVDARGSAPPPAWTRVSARGISGNDLSRKALTSPTTVARVGERQFLRDAEEMANAKRRAALAAEKRAIEAAEKARLAALEAANTPPRLRASPRTSSSRLSSSSPPRGPPRACTTRESDRPTDPIESRASDRTPPGSRSRSSTVTWITLAGRRNRRARLRPPRPRRAPSPADADAILSILPPWVGFLTPLFFFVPLLFSSSPSRRRLFSEVDDDDGDVILGSEPDGALDERVRELIRAHVRVLLRLLLDERRALGGVDRVP